MKMHEIIRHFNETAIRAGRDRISDQTGYVHHHYHIDGVPQTIPVLENLIFTYALLKNKSTETIQEAKDLLRKILYFQCSDESTSQSNFPIYLHEFPQCKDRLLSISLLPVFYWIINQFGSILGVELSKKLQNAVEKLIQHSLHSYKERLLPYSYRLKLSSSLSVFGALFNDKNLSTTAQSVMSIGEKDQPTSDWFSPACLADMLISLQLEGGSLTESGWTNLWEHLCNTYSSTVGTYVGPSLQNYYWMQKPQLTLYDFYMCSCAQIITGRVNDDSIVQLHSSLIQPHENILSDRSFPVALEGEIEGKQWSLYRDQSICSSTLSDAGNKLNSQWKGILPMQLFIVDDVQPISIVAQGGNYTELNGITEGTNVQLEYELSENVDVDHKEEKKEVILSVTRHKDLSIFVNGGKSNTFNLGDEITLHLKTHTASISFEVIKGDGRFIGHIMPGNRASQLALKSANRFNAYDWQLFLRTLTRSSHCRIKVKVTVQRLL